MGKEHSGIVGLRRWAGAGVALLGAVSGSTWGSATPGRPAGPLNELIHYAIPADANGTPTGGLSAAVARAADGSTAVLVSDSSCGHDGVVGGEYCQDAYSGLYLYRLDRNGKRVGSPILVKGFAHSNTPEVSASFESKDSDVAIDASGRIYVAWIGGFGGTDLYLDRYGADGSHLGRSTLWTTTGGPLNNTYNGLDLEVTPDGSRGVVSFDDGDNCCERRVVVVRFDAAGQRLGTAIDVDPAADSEVDANGMLSSVAITPSGGFVATWVRVGLYSKETGTTQKVLFRRYSAAGGALDASPRELRTHTYQGPYFPPTLGGPDVATDGNGNFVVAWRDHGDVCSFGDGYCLRAQRYNAAGTARGPAFEVFGIDEGDRADLAYAPVVAVANDGRFSVMGLLIQHDTIDENFHSWYSPGLRHYDASGNPVGDIVDLFPTIRPEREGDGLVHDPGTPINYNTGPYAADELAYAIDGSGNGIATINYYRNRYEADGDRTGVDYYVNAQEVSSFEPVDSEVTKTAPANAELGEPYEYVLRVTNNHANSALTGNTLLDELYGMARGVVVQDRLPAGVDPVLTTAHDFLCGIVGRLLTCSTLEPILAGEFKDIVVRVVPTAVGNVTNTADVESLSFDDVASNDTDSVTTLVRDLPDAFGFPTVRRAATGTQVCSAAVTPVGYSTTLVARALGAATTKFRVNGGALVRTANVSPGDNLRLCVVSSASPGRAVVGRLDLGGVIGLFRVITGESDTTPVPLVLPNVTGAAPGTLVTSAVAAVSGINTPVTLSLSGPVSTRVSINGGEFVSGPVQVNDGDTVQLRVRSSPTAGRQVRIRVTVGTLARIWTVRTR